MTAYNLGWLSGDGLASVAVTGEKTDDPNMLKVTFRLFVRAGKFTTWSWDNEMELFARKSFVADIEKVFSEYVLSLARHGVWGTMSEPLPAFQNYRSELINDFDLTW